MKRVRLARRYVLNATIFCFRWNDADANRNPQFYNDFIMARVGGELDSLSEALHDIRDLISR